ncbi:WD40/YVTN/BNR-like repeat-containing protein [Marinicella sp. W31]|uniref:WD40/YVTN/BNR-like repeat-containing protein n=1 Tax=Marinicella sp. W31 TaxID=3023713 RepID=UPI003757640A
MKTRALKNKLFCFILLMVCLSVNAQTPSKIMPLADESLIIAMTQHGDQLIAVGERGHVLKSTDQAKSWSQFDNIPVNVLLTDVTGIGQHIWAVGHDTTIIHSADGGDSWEIQFYDPDREVPLLSVLFINEQTGFAIGAYGTILKTNNGGVDWQDELISEELDYHLNAMTVMDENRIFIAAEAGYGFRSEDAGVTFEPVEMPYPGSMFGVTAVGDTLIAHGLRGHVQLSFDFGETWEELSNNVLNSLFSAAVLNDNEVILVGANGTRLLLDVEKRMLKNAAASDTGRDFSDVMVIDKQLLMVGEEGFYQQLIQP